MARQEWALWRLVMSGKISWTEVSQMDLHTLMEANAALDIHIELEKKANKPKKKG